MPDLPSGTVTFLFSDVEGSTQLLERHGSLLQVALQRHHQLFVDIVSARHGAIFETVGDAVYAAFGRASDAVGAALALQLALATEDWGEIGRVACRMAIHTGEAEPREGHYFSPALFRCARLQALGYGEQTLLSGLTARLMADALPGGVALRDLGMHRLKDLGEPEHVFMLLHPELRDTFPPPKSLDLRPNNLPSELSSLIGREADVRTLGGLIEDHRLVTVVGAGGIGKTRLALQAAAEASDRFADGVFFIDLSGVTDPELALPAVATTLGVRETAPLSLGETLNAFLESRQVLLVLDNFEHLIRAAPDIARLLQSTPRTKIVATSRTPLHLRGEQRFELGPLEVSETRIPSAAVRLFEERARELDVRFRVSAEMSPVLVELCRRLDGMPLAIELAAARTRALSPSSILAELNTSMARLGSTSSDQPARQRTMAATISWSLESAPEHVRDAFASLGAFAGGFTVESAATVLRREAAAVADVVEELLDRSLIRVMPGDGTDTRYAMYEPIRDGARGLLAGDLSAVQDDHAAYFTALAEELEPAVRRTDQRALARLIDERDNIRAALAADFETGQTDRASRLAAAMSWFWILTGATTEGRTALARALEGSGIPPSTRARALSRLGAILVTQGRAAEALPVLSEAAEFERDSDNPGALAFALNFVGRAFSDEGELNAAEAAYDEGLAAARSAGDLPTEMWIQANRGVMEERAGDFDGYEAQMALVAEIAERLDDANAATVARVNLAEAAAARGDVVRAESQFRDLLRAGAAAPHGGYAGGALEMAYAAGALAVVLALQEKLHDAAAAAADALDRSRAGLFVRELLVAADVAAFVGSSFPLLIVQAKELLIAVDMYRTAYRVPRDVLEERLTSRLLAHRDVGSKPDAHSRVPDVAEIADATDALLQATRSASAREDASIAAGTHRRSTRPV